ncbi:MAG: YfaZ family outer membrane protein [Steroidobacteraceae bacterium]
MRFPMLIACGLALVAAQQVYAQEPRPAGSATYLDATFGNSVLQLRYLAPSPINPANSRTDLDYGFLLSESRDLIGTAALLFHTDLNLVPRLRFEIGPQAYFALLNAVQKTNVFAVAFGGSARYELIPRLGVSAFGGAFYSPGVLTFGNAHNVYDFTAGGEVRFTSRLVGEAGYRWLKFTLVGEPDDRVQNEVFAGLRWQMR